LVARLRPSKALAQIDTVSVTEAVRTMAEKRFDATLLVDSEGGLSGILTDKGASIFASILLPQITPTVCTS
jgi:hypothetical protein